MHQQLGLAPSGAGAVGWGALSERCPVTWCVPEAWGKLDISSPTPGQAFPTPERFPPTLEREGGIRSLTLVQRLL